MPLEPEDYEHDDGVAEPWYEVEDIGCKCTEGGIESEWWWDAESGCYVCQGCGDVQ